jgi:hypothetical protein
MGSVKLKPDKIQFNIAPEHQEVFAKGHIVRLVRGQRKEDFFRELVEEEIKTPDSVDILAHRWLRWNQFEAAMKDEGYSVNRVTMWNYKKRPEFVDLIRGDGIDAIFDIDGILKVFRGA